MIMFFPTMLTTQTNDNRIKSCKSNPSLQKMITIMKKSTENRQRYEIPLQWCMSLKTMEHISASQKITVQALNLHTSIDHPLPARATATNFHITFPQRYQEHHTTPAPMSTSAVGALSTNLEKLTL